MVTGVVLCGGRGRRLSGKDKPLEHLANRALVDWVVERLEPQVDHLLISANRNLETYGSFGHQVITDDVAEHTGPLAGIRAALRQRDDEWLFACPGDVPLLPEGIVDTLRQAIGRDTAAYAYDGEHAQYLHMMVAASAAASLDEFLNDGGRAVRSWLSSCDAVAVDCSTLAGSFQGLNEPEDLRLLEALLG
jgi:molybdopterin-guanine dinucleotide biosynthesis protein A